MLSILCVSREKRTVSIKASSEFTNFALLWGVRHELLSKQGRERNSDDVVLKLKGWGITGVSDEGIL